MTARPQPAIYAGMFFIAHVVVEDLRNAKLKCRTIIALTILVLLTAAHVQAEEHGENEDCTCECMTEAVTKQQKYSRGNNDCDEMKAQKVATGKYQYKTATFELGVTVKSIDCFCVTSCKGSMNVKADLLIKDLDPGFLGAAELYVLVNGPNPSAASKDDGGAVPKPNVTTVIDKVNLPAVQKGNKAQKNNGEISMQATATIPCIAGTYSRRFYVVESNLAGKKNITPGTSYNPVFYIDVNITLTEVAKCTLSTSIEAFLLEFVPNYDFEHNGDPCGPLAGAADELPVIKHNGANAGETRNIAKLIEEDGVKVDEPFADKATP